MNQHPVAALPALRRPSARPSWRDWAVAALAGAVLTFHPVAPAALACDGCDSHDKCTHGLQQGTYGCSSGEMECTFTSKIFFGCGGRWCATSSLPCDNKRMTVGATSWPGDGHPGGLCGPGRDRAEDPEDSLTGTDGPALSLEP